jgi:hypothetical protein
MSQLSNRTAVRGGNDIQTPMLSNRNGQSGSPGQPGVSQFLLKK